MSRKKTPVDLDLQTALRKGAKLPPITTLKILRNFAYGYPPKLCAKTLGISLKTVRDHYALLRERLLEPAFNKWHGTGVRIVPISDPAVEEDMRFIFIDILASCHNNTECWRRYQSSKRKARLCRSCPLPKLIKPENIDTALNMVDAPRLYYASLHWGREKKPDDPRHQFRLRLVHTMIMATTADNTPSKKSGGFDYTDRHYLSFRTLAQTLLENVLENPL